MNVLERVKNIIGEILKVESIVEKTNLIEEYSIDSLQAIEILVMIENEFEISIDDEDLNMRLLESPKVLCEYVEKKLGQL